MKLIVKLPIVLLLLATMLLVGCAGDGGGNTPVDGTGTKPTTGDGATEESTEGEPEYPFEVEAFGTAEKPTRFVIAARNERSDYLDAEYDSDTMHRATFERNALIEELYSIRFELKEIGHSDGKDFLPALEAEYYSGAGDYDLICPAWWWGTDLKGYYVNLLNHDDVINLNDPWWFDGWNDNVTFAGYMSSIMGEAQFDTYYNMEVLYFNKKIAQSIGLNPYEYVDNMTWTLEVVNTYGEMAVDDVNGVFGSLLNAESSIYTALYSLGVKYSENKDGEVTLLHKDEANYNAFNSFFTFVNERPHNVVANTSTLGAEATDPFINGQALFCWQAFRVGPTIYNSEKVEFGIVPCPMLNEDQGEYITAIYDATNFSIMSTSRDTHMSAVILNAMNALTEDYMTNLYFDEVMGLRIAGDEDSSRMIPLIRDSLYCDFAWINIGHLDYCTSKYGAYIIEGKPDISSKIDTEYDSWIDMLEIMRKKMVEYRDREA